MSSQKYRNAIPAGNGIGSYRVENILGQGGFGITYLARDEKLERDLAIKEYFPLEFSRREADGSVCPQSADDEEVYKWGLDRFLAEGKTLARFKHPHIVRVIDYLEENNTAYIIMEYEHGSDLQTLLKSRKTLSCDEIQKIFLPLLDGLAIVHDAGYIHRDIKPANIFIREDGSPVLIDFGSAREGMASRTKTLTTLVSPGYAPFEQYNNDPANRQGPWTDIYALGASMYKCLFGRSPLDAVSRAEEKLAGHEDPLISATDLGRSHYPARILEAIDRSLAFLPSDRPQNIRDWLAILVPGHNDDETDAYDEETIKVSAAGESPEQENTGETTPVAQLEQAGLRLAVTKYIVLGMLTFWSYTSYMLCTRLDDFAAGIGSVHVNRRPGLLFSAGYLLIMLLVLSWIVPNVFMGHVFGEKYILRVVLISSVLFYANTVAFVVWYMKQIKKIDVRLLDEGIKQQAAGEKQAREARNAMIAKWEAIDNHVVLFLVISLPLVFSPYICAGLFFAGVSGYLLSALPIIVMLLGGAFHIWGTRLLINTYNNMLAG